MTITDYAHRWAFEEGSGTGTADDWQAANGATGALTANLGSGASWVTGKIGSFALSFDKSSNGYANFGSSVNFGNGYSLAMWFQVDDVASNADGVIWGGPNGNYVLYFDNTNLYHSAGVGNFVTVAHAGLASLRSWNHYGIRRDPVTGDCDFFMNGSRVGATQTMGAGFVNNLLLLSQFGSYDSTVSPSQFPARARVDDARSYGRLLTNAEFTALYNYSAGGTAYSQSGSDSVAVTSSLSRSTAASRATSDATTVSAALSQTTVRPRATSDAVSVTDASSRVVARSRSLADSVALSDTNSRTKTAPRSTSDSVTVSSSLARLVTLARSLADSMALGDALSRAITLSRVTVDPVTITDTTGTSGRSSQAGADSITVTDSADRAVSRPRSTSDSFSVSDTAARGGLALPRAVVDLVAMTDAATRTSSRSRSIGDATTINDQATSMRVLGRSTGDAVRVADAASRSTGVVRVVGESLVLSTSTTRSTSSTRVTFDILVVNDAETMPTAIERMTITSRRGSRITGVGARLALDVKGSRSNPISSIGTKS